MIDEIVTGVMNWLANGDEDQEGLCATEEDPQHCYDLIYELIRPALNALHTAAVADNITGPILCNEAVPDTCSVCHF